MALHCKCLYFVPFLKYSTSNNGVSLKSELGVIESHWKWRDFLSFCYCTLYTALYCIIFELFLAFKNVVTLKSSVRHGVTQNHWKWRHAIDRIRVPIIVVSQYHSLLLSLWLIDWLIDWLFDFHCSYGHILYRFWDKARYWLKIAIFSERYVVNAPLLRSLFRLSACDALELWINRGFFCRMNLLTRHNGPGIWLRCKKTTQKYSQPFFLGGLYVDGGLRIAIFNQYQNINQFEQPRQIH